MKIGKKQAKSSSCAERSRTTLQVWAYFQRASTKNWIGLTCSLTSALYRSCDWYLSIICQYLRHEIKRRSVMYNHYGNGRRKLVIEEQDKGDKEDRKWMSRWGVFCWRCLVTAKICIEGDSGKKVTQGKGKIENQVLSTIESLSFKSSAEQSLPKNVRLLAWGAIHQHSILTLRRKCGSWFRKAQRLQWAIQLLDSLAFWWT